MTILAWVIADPPDRYPHPDSGLSALFCYTHGMSEPFVEARREQIIIRLQADLQDLARASLEKEQRHLKQIRHLLVENAQLTREIEQHREGYVLQV